MRPGLPVGLTRVLAGLGSALGELLRIGREMLAIPTQLWLAVAEIAGALVLAGWRSAVRIALYAYDRAIEALEWAQRRVPPAYGVIAVCVAAAVALAASQFVDYRGVTIGTPEYSEVQSVAPAPEIEHERTGEAHGWVGLPIAFAAIVITAIAAAGRWRAARLLVPLGLLAVAVALAVDRPRGLDEADVAVAYEGAEAMLIEGFWAQLAAGTVLICCGFLLAARLRPDAVRSRRREHSRSPRPDGSRVLADPPIETQGTNP